MQLGRFVARHLPASDDISILVLKGHLLAETFLNTYLAERLPNPAALDGARLTFKQRSALVAALHQEGERPWLWDLLDKLNSLRNELAHSLDRHTGERKLHAFLKSHQAPY